MVHFGVSLDILSEKYYILFNTNSLIKLEWYLKEFQVRV